MYNPACVVNLHLLPPPSSPRQSSASRGLPEGTCCGVVVDTERGLILAHASCLGPFVEQGDLDLASLPLTLEENQRLSCKVLLQKEGEGCPGRHEERVSGVPVSTAPDRETSVPHVDVLHGKGDVHTENSRRSKNGFHAFQRFPATVVHFFHCPAVGESLQALMPEPSWEFLDRKDVKADDNNNNKNNNSHSRVQAEADTQALLSSFMILRVQGWKPYRSCLRVRPTRDCRVGERVEVCSTPFGGQKPEAFINSWSRGIISNLAGQDRCLLLSDARCILGGEGAPLYTFHDHLSGPQRCLTGVIIASLCWKNQEWVGFCMACDIAAVLGSASPLLQDVLEGHSSRSLPGEVKVHSFPQGTCRPEVVLLNMGSTWGSGVVIDADLGVILTCSHVIKEAHRHPVEVQRERGGRMERTKVVYRQHPVRQQFDLAVVQAPPSPATTVRLASPPLTVGVPEEGMEVFVVGHAVFGAEHHLPPSMTCGVISKVIRVNKVPVMVQTTCAVHPGASGGAVVDTRGRLLAIVVCNTRENSCGASFPHVNMSIPVCTVWPVVTAFLRTQEARHLERLKVKNDMVNTVWSLNFMQDTGMAPQMSKL